MSRIKHPREKKRLSLSKDHRVFALEGNKTFRKAWRLKKARAARKTRRGEARELVSYTRDQGADGPTAAPKTMRSLKKYGVMSLDQTISFKEGDRIGRWHMGVLGRNKEAIEAAGCLPKRGVAGLARRNRASARLRPTSGS
jgi:hypothetical protein